MNKVIVVYNFQGLLYKPVRRKREGIFVAVLSTQGASGRRRVICDWVVRGPSTCLVSICPGENASIHPVPFTSLCFLLYSLFPPNPVISSEQGRKEGMPLFGSTGYLTMGQGGPLYLLSSPGNNFCLSPFITP